jgi:hypothetical protein
MNTCDEALLGLGGQEYVRRSSTGARWAGIRATKLYWGLVGRNTCDEALLGLCGQWRFRIATSPSSRDACRISSAGLGPGRRWDIRVGPGGPEPDSDADGDVRPPRRRRAGKSAGTPPAPAGDGARAAPLPPPPPPSPLPPSPPPSSPPPASLSSRPSARMAPLPRLQPIHLRRPAAAVRRGLRLG